MTLVLYPGSFDPLTNGHANLIARGLKIYGRLIVAVAHNRRKTPLFTPQERMAMIRASLGADSPVEIDTFEGLLVDYAKRRGATVILRGLRAVSDFEFEFQLAHINRRIGAGLETVFMMTGEEHFYVSSKMVKEIASFGGQVTGMVPPLVEARLQEKFAP
ncbi:MAG: pantetheine-phosphate adenylyltransferase [Deltaproteobacteria bacterium]|nr:MAG: pantetheine-phosphate adenylyltransferase [Deltaproteobacteria bacterium]